MGRDTGIASRLRDAGLRVVEVDDWQARGSSDFGPKGSVAHHTAGSSSGATPSLNTCINGRPDLAGPLCNVFQSREPDGRDIAYVVAAGKANHAGEGTWNGLTGNASVYGLETEHTGTSPMPEGRIDIAARIHAAMHQGDVQNVCQHYEWAAGGRKVDMATNVGGQDFRARVSRARQPLPPKPSEDDVSVAMEGPDGRVYATDGITKRHIANRQQLNELALTGAVRLGPDGKEWRVSQETIDDIPEGDRT
jgi:hypothetical protein